MNKRHLAAVAIITAIFLSTPSHAADRAFILGYGSLMSTHSRTSSAPDPDNIRFIPVKLSNHARTWNLWMKRIGMRVLGVEENQGTYMNGLLYEVPAGNLAKFDAREGPACERSKLNLNDFVFYNPADTLLFAESNDNIEIYVYKPIKQDVSKGGYYLTNPLKHTDKTIAQSYLYVVVAGCIEVDKNNDLNGIFLSDCMDTLGHRGLPVEQDLSNPKSPSHPINLFRKAKTQLSQREQYLQNDWQSYLQQIETLLNPAN